MAEKKQEELTKEQERMLENVHAVIAKDGTKDYELLLKKLQEDAKAELKIIWRRRELFLHKSGEEIAGVKQIKLPSLMIELSNSSSFNKSNL